MSLPSSAIIILSTCCILTKLVFQSS